MSSSSSQSNIDKASEQKNACRKTKYCGNCQKPQKQNFLRHAIACHKGQPLTEWIPGEDGKGHKLPYFKGNQQKHVQPVQPAVEARSEAVHLGKRPFNREDSML